MHKTYPANVTPTFLKTQSEILRRRKHRIKLFSQGFLSHGIIWVVGLFFIVPFLWMVSTSFKSDQDVFRNPPTILPHDNLRITLNGNQYALYDVTQNNVTQRLALVKIIEGSGTFLDPLNPSLAPVNVRMKFAQPVLQVALRWQNYPDALNRSTRSGIGATFFVYFKNSLIIAFFTILGTLLSCAPVAYGFARLRWPGREWVFILVLATMMLPFQATMIPLYKYFNEVLHWGDSFLPLIVPAFFANPYDIFLLRQFFRTIPEEMCDAARVDGASEIQIFTQIVLPLSTPVLAVVTVTTFLWAWNDFTGPLIYLTSPKNFTMALGLQDFQGQHIVSYNLLMAASAIFTIPIIIAFFFAQKSFVQGFKLTGSKE